MSVDYPLFNVRAEQSRKSQRTVGFRPNPSRLAASCTMSKTAALSYIYVVDRWPDQGKAADPLSYAPPATDLSPPRFLVLDA
jgi:hypothetical protein